MNMSRRTRYRNMGPCRESVNSRHGTMIQKPSRFTYPLRYMHDTNDVWMLESGPYRLTLTQSGSNYLHCNNLIAWNGQEIHRSGFNDTSNIVWGSGIPFVCEFATPFTGYRGHGHGNTSINSISYPYVVVDGGPAISGGGLYNQRAFRGGKVEFYNQLLCANAGTTYLTVTERFTVTRAYVRIRIEFQVNNAFTITLGGGGANVSSWYMETHNWDNRNLECHFTDVAIRRTAGLTLVGPSDPQAASIGNTLNTRMWAAFSSDRNVLSVTDLRNMDASILDYVSGACTSKVSTNRFDDSAGADPDANYYKWYWEDARFADAVYLATLPTFSWDIFKYAMWSSAGTWTTDMDDRSIASLLAEGAVESS